MPFGFLLISVCKAEAFATATWDNAMNTLNTPSAGVLSLLSCSIVPEVAAAQGSQCPARSKNPCWAGQRPAQTAAFSSANPIREKSAKGVSMKTDVYTEVTNRIIAQLEKGVVPWQSPYFSKTGFPKNFVSGKAYQGINVFLLGSLRYTSPWFLTFLQAKELGGNVRKGERGSLVIKYGTYSKEDDHAAAHEPTEEQRRYLKAYTVFHASQIEGISFPEPETLPELTSTVVCDRARGIVAGMPNPPKFGEGSAIPCYRPSTDSVNMPERRYFTSEEAYYSTLFHELCHYAAILIMPRRCIHALMGLVPRRGMSA
jgi:antirestriction protein ArdC